MSNELQKVPMNNVYSDKALLRYTNKCVVEQEMSIPIVKGYHDMIHPMVKPEMLLDRAVINFLLSTVSQMS